jgi:TonB family protein
MKFPLRSLFLSLIVLGLLTGRVLAATPGYQVIVEITYDEQGNAVDGKVVSSDDPTGAQTLNQIALDLSAKVKQTPRVGKDGKPQPFKVRAPFNFPVEGDEGAAANQAPKPALKQAAQPVYPENLAAAGTTGGVILELIIGGDGQVKKADVMRTSHTEFANAAQAAVLRWQFVPAQKDGVAVESRWRIAVNFSVDGKVPEWQWVVAPRPNLGAFTCVRPKLPAAEPAAAAPAEKK